ALRQEARVTATPMNAAPHQRSRKINTREDTMIHRFVMGAAALAAAVLVALSGALAFDDSEYPNFKGQWRRMPVPGVRGQISFDQHKDWGKGQGAPLTPEYQAVYENNLKIQEGGSTGEWLGISCLGFGMP